MPDARSNSTRINSGAFSPHLRQCVFSAANIAAVVLCFAGCHAPLHREARLQAGMSRAEVIALVGPPRSVVHNGSLQVLQFDLKANERGGPRAIARSYYVVFGRDRRVQSFGPN